MTRTISVRFEQDAYFRMRKVAYDEHRSMSRQVAQLVDEALEWRDREREAETVR